MFQGNVGVLFQRPGNLFRKPVSPLSMAPAIEEKGSARALHAALGPTPETEINFSKNSFSLAAFEAIFAPMMKSVAKEKNISFKYKFGKTLKIRADPDRIMQVLNNYISNAIKFTGEKGKIIINLEKKRNNIIVKVKDSDRKSTRLNSSHTDISRMPSSA